MVRVQVTKGPVPETYKVELDLNQASWHADGPVGVRKLVPSALDLIEIARVVWEIERGFPKRISSQRVSKVEVEMPVRDVRVWGGAQCAMLTAILRLMGNSEWTFSFTQRSSGNPSALDAVSSTLNGHAKGRAEAVALFSGGLDSTSGLGWLRQRGEQPTLASFYGSKAKQAALANELGFSQHLQVACIWNTGARRLGGQFQFRSLLFLALGAAAAESFAASTLYQFENGPLAISLPPSETYRMTRHAHPRLHALAGRLFSDVLGASIKVVNPFLLMTKRESTAFLRSGLGPKNFSRIVRSTESCWNLQSRQVIGDIKKDVGAPCGLCVPCLVRVGCGRHDSLRLGTFAGAALTS